MEVMKWQTFVGYSLEGLLEQAAEFATRVGRANLISVSHSTTGGTELLGFGGKKTVIVCYWG